MKSKSIKAVILSLCSLTTVLGIYLLVSNIRLLGDDLWYYTFLRHDSKYFFDQLATHYIYGNGRLFVHTVLAFFLAFDNLLVIQIINSLMLIVMIIFIVKIVKPEKQSLYCVFLTSISLFLIIGNYIISDSYLWLSGSFNYVFPIMLLLIYAYLLKESAAKPHYVSIIITCLLSAVTTELNGILTLGISIAYCFSCIRSKKHLKFSIVNATAAFLGTLSLLLSPGIILRFNANGDGDGIIRRCLVSFTTFSQMSWERNGLSCIIMISALICCIGSFFILKNKILSCLNAFIFIAAAITVCGVSFSAYFCMLLSGIYLITLMCYSIAFYNKKCDTVLITCVLSLIASLAVICVSAEATYRMLFVPSICLMIIAIRSLILSKVPESVLTIIMVVLCVSALINNIVLFSVNEKNSDIWDDNQKTIQSYDGEGVLYIKNVDDERYFQSAFQEYFLDWYLSEYNVGKDVIVERTENVKYKLIDENNNVISDDIIKRGNDYYIYCRTLADYLDAEVTWKYGTANIIYNGDVYRLKTGLESVITRNIGGNSIKLLAPIRGINDRIYISVQDACSIFGLNLRIE